MTTAAPRSEHFSAGTLGLLVSILFSVVQPASAAHLSVTAYFPAGFNDGAYQQTAMKQVTGKFHAPAKAPAAGKKCVVIATISRSGKVAGTLINLSSGSKDWDAAALAAVQGASPFSQVGKDFPGQQLEVHFHFAVVP